MEKDQWLIWSIEHSAWWKPYHNGYTSVRGEAGEYSFDEACDIVQRANVGLGTWTNMPSEAMVKA
jgi:hypothetical protein